MKLRALSILLGVLPLVSCFSSARWNADQVKEIRKRAAFDMSCAREDVDVVEVNRDKRGLVRKLRADGCGQRLTFVNAKDDPAAAQWTLGSNLFQAANPQHPHTSDTALR
jgi:hypothetical protein